MTRKSTKEERHQERMTVRQVIEALQALEPEYSGEPVVAWHEGTRVGRHVTAVYLTEPENPSWAIEVVLEVSDVPPITITRVSE